VARWHGGTVARWRGGAAAGQPYHGTAAAVANNSPSDIGQGRLLPTPTVKPLAAALGRWLAMSDIDLLTVLFNLRNDSTRKLGFV
jgi:hypothetical protein